jgi:fructose-1,6-bisphosphatase I
VLQRGTRQLAAGYVVYGSSTMLVYTTGHGVHGFTLEPEVGAFVLSHENLKMPAQGNYYSTNEAKCDSFPPEYQRFLSRLRQGFGGRSYSSRYIGSFVADFHRTLLKGNVFLYPPTADQPEGKLRLLYEAGPMAYLAEQASGKAVAGTERIMEIEPTTLHQRVPVVIGSTAEVDEFLKCVDQCRKA